MLTVRAIWLIRISLLLFLISSIPLYKWTSWIRSYNNQCRRHTIDESDLPIRYQLALNESLAPSWRGEKCCFQADWTPNATERAREQIPRIIHQTWKNETIPKGEWTTAHDFCLKINPEPEWRHILWTDHSAREFVTLYYPDLLHIYDSFPHPIQRVDVIRYLILHQFGGVYIDLDIGCARPMDALLILPAFFPRTDPMGVSNDLIGARPGHPIMKQLADAILLQNSPTYRKTFLQTVISLLGSTYITVFFSTGPMFVNFELSTYFTHHDDVKLLPPRFYSETLSSFFMHFQGSSWHGGDAQSIKFLANHAFWIPIIGGILWLHRRRRGMNKS